MDFEVVSNTILEPERYFKEARNNFIAYYNENISLFLEAEKSLAILISRILESESIQYSKITSRVKNRSECIKKFDRKYRDQCEKSSTKYQIEEHITDLIGIRIVCFYDSEIELVRAALESHLRVIDVTDKRDFENPNEFGYKGLHLDIKLDEQRASIIEYSEFSEFNFEIQIRTIVQDAWSEVDHKLQYKREIPDSLKRKINALAALFEMADRDFMFVRHETEKLFEEQREAPFESTANDPLDAISFITISEPFFEGFRFDQERTDQFVTSVKDQDPDITKGQFKEAITINIERVLAYNKYQREELNHRGGNPVTLIRFCLYLQKPVVFENLVFPGLRKNLDRWIEYGTVMPAEIRALSRGGLTDGEL